MSILAVLGISAGFLQLVAAAPYFAAIARRKTKPERATWWIWSLLNIIAVAAQIGAHAQWSLLMSICQAVINVAIAVLSLTHGYGRFGVKDWAAMAFAVGGIGLWWLLKSPLVALLVVLVVDFVAYWLTLAKTWDHPRTEAPAMWGIATVSGLLGVLAVGAWNGTRMIYPLYITLVNGIMVFVILTRRARRRRTIVA